MSKLKDFHTTDKQARTWKKRISGAIKALKWAKRGTTTLVRVAKAMMRVGAASPVPLWEQKEGEREARYDNLRDIADAAKEGATGVPMSEETQKRLKAQKQKIATYLPNKNIDARTTARREAVTARSKRFADTSNQGNSKGKGGMVKSVFKTAQLSQNIGWARRADGSLADTPDALGEVVKDKFEQWFQSVIGVEGR